MGKIFIFVVLGVARGAGGWVFVIIQSWSPTTLVRETASDFDGGLGEGRQWWAEPTLRNAVNEHSPEIWVGAYLCFGLACCAG